MKSYKLNSGNLAEISKEVAVPGYDRSKVTPGIVHVGIGGFHRSHQAYYTDELLHDDSVTQWGICGVALLEFDKKIYHTLKEQDGLYTLMVKEFDGSLTERVIGSIVEYMYAPENPMAVIEKMANPDIKIISLTITEGGYNYNEATGKFEIQNPSIQHDLVHPESPKTVFGYLAQALRLRRENNVGGCTIQSCDNIQGNGDFTKKMLLSYLKYAEPDLVSWVESHVSFPNSMVDRITPATQPNDVESLKDSTGIIDAWPVVCEPFKQWVIEDEFIGGRPQWEKVDAQFVKDVMPYEKMKLSLLNAGHSVLGIIGALMGFSTIDEALNNTSLRVFLKAYMDEEVTPVLGEVKGMDLFDYKQSLLNRFGNIYIKDQIERICSESSAKIPIFVLPTVYKQLKGGQAIQCAAHIIAAWAIYSLGVDEQGRPLERKDVMKDILNEKALVATEVPTAFLDIESIFGELGKNDEFVRAYTEAYRNINKKGVEKAIQIINNKMLSK